MSGKLPRVGGVGGPPAPGKREEKGGAWRIWTPFPASDAVGVKNYRRWPGSGVSSTSALSVKMKPRVQVPKRSLKAVGCRDE